MREPCFCCTVTDTRKGYCGTFLGGQLALSACIEPLPVHLQRKWRLDETVSLIFGLWPPYGHGIAILVSSKWSEQLWNRWVLLLLWCVVCMHVSSIRSLDVYENLDRCVRTRRDKNLVDSRGRVALFAWDVDWRMMWQWNIGRIQFPAGKQITAVRLGIMRSVDNKWSRRCEISPLWPPGKELEAQWWLYAYLIRAKTTQVSRNVF